VKHQGKLIVGVAAVAIAAGVALSLMRKPDAPEARFATLAGESFVTSSLRGQVVLVNFWATSCVTCVAEMPKFVETQQKFGPRGYTTVAVAMSYDHPNRVAEFATARKLPFKVALDTSGDVARRFGNISVTPTTFLIDRRGRVLRQYLGEPDWAEFHALIERALSDPA
jgi:peroxiredoxin